MTVDGMTFEVQYLGLFVFEYALLLGGAFFDQAAFVYTIFAALIVVLLLAPAPKCEPCLVSVRTSFGEKVRVG